MKTLELIDYKLRSNLIRLYFGENGKQNGDDWDDVPYEHNASIVEDKFVKLILDMIIGFDYDVYEPADDFPSNSPYCRNDFISRKIYAFKIIPPYTRELEIKIYFGDNLQDIIMNIAKYADMQIIKIYA